MPRKHGGLQKAGKVGYLHRDFRAYHTSKKGKKILGRRKKKFPRMRLRRLFSSLRKRRWRR